MVRDIGPTPLYFAVPLTMSSTPRFALLFALCVCNRGPARQQPEPAPPSSVAEALGVDAGAFIPPVDPSPPAGDLAAELAHFSTLDACVKEHAGLDPLVGDALRSVGYETFVRDACRLLESTKAKSVAKCAPIDASSLRERCEAYVAMATASPDACPRVSPEEPSAGREATCVAVAARDARLCAAEEHARRASCEALVLGEERRCAEAPEGARDECRRAVARWKGVLGPPRSPGELPTPRGTLTVSAPAGAPPLARRESDLREALGRGV